MSITLLVQNFQFLVSAETVAPSKPKRGPEEQTAGLSRTKIAVTRVPEKADSMQIIPVLTAQKKQTAIIKITIPSPIVNPATQLSAQRKLESHDYLIQTLSPGKFL